MKVSRHAKIIELITQHDIETQEELAEYLEDAGFKVTQATVSRDIRDLKLTKMSVDGSRQKYVILKPEEGMSEKYIRPEYPGDQDGLRNGDGRGSRR